MTEKPTASPMGMNMKRAGPSRNTTLTKTMEIESDATKAGTAICEAPSRIAWTKGLPMARLRWMFSTSTVASSTKMPTAKARPPSVITLMVWPRALSARSAATTDSGIETATTMVLRQLPRKRRIIVAVRPAAMRPSMSKPSMARVT